MTTEQLSELTQDWFCGCGRPEAAYQLVYDVLELMYQDRETKMPYKEYAAALDKLLPTDGVFYFILYTLDNLGLTEHGGSVGGSWLTEKGERVLGALRREAADGFESLCSMRCCHGYLIEDTRNCPECGKLYTK